MRYLFKLAYICGLVPIFHMEKEKENFSSYHRYYSFFLAFIIFIIHLIDIYAIVFIFLEEELNTIKVLLATQYSLITMILILAIFFFDLQKERMEQFY